MFKIAIGGGNDADVGGEGFIGAHAFEGTFPQEPQQLDLNGLIDLANLIEEQRAAIGLFEAADAAFVRAGERAFFVTNNSLSNSVGERAAQCTVTSGCLARGLRLWMALAMSSFPCRSPSTSTLARAGATCWTISKIPSIAGD